MVEIKASMQDRFQDELPCGSINSDELPPELHTVVDLLRATLRQGTSVVDPLGAADEPMDAPQWAVMFREGAVTFGFTGSSWSLKNDAQKLVDYLDENLPKTPREDALRLFHEIKDGLNNK